MSDKIKYTATITARDPKTNKFTQNVAVWVRYRNTDETQRNALDTVRTLAEREWPLLKGRMMISIEDFSLIDAFDALHDVRDFLQSLGYTSGDVVENLARAEKRLTQEIQRLNMQK